MLRKLHIFILVSALSLMLSSCTKDNAEQYVNGVEWAKDLSVSVPVEFRVADDVSLSTKAEPVNNVSHLSDHNFGIIAFSSEFRDNNALIRGRARMDSDGSAYFVDSLGDRVTVSYPFLSPNNYNFYGYYTGDDSSYEKADLLGTEYGIVIENYGKVDVLYGASCATPIDIGGESIEGFNANYFRTLYAYGMYGDEYLPNIRMRHLCTMINFYFRYEDEQDASARAYISRIAACGVDYSGHLYFRAGKIETFTRGKIQYLTKQWIGSRAVTIPEANFFLSPDDLDELYFEISINYASNVSPLTAVITAEQIKQVLADNNVDGFKAGSRYSFDVTFRPGVFSYVTELSAHKTK